jgi:hypothetical protein
MGGSLVTAGGAVFIGTAMGERFHGYDAARGKLCGNLISGGIRDSRDVRH